MKIKIKLLFFTLLIFSSNILAGRLFYLHPQSEELFADTLKIKNTFVNDTTVKKVKKEILLPLKNPSLLENHFNNSFLSKEKLSTIDYRTTADFFTNIPFGFVRDLGSVGQPNESLIYGNGFGNISFLSNGIPINNRLSNSLDLNLFQSESVDSVEIIPLVRGFLFGSINNSVSVNFISREPDIRKPFSRLKYYQGSNSEGMIDGIFNITPFNKFNAYIEISNHGVKPYYKNTDYSNWSGTARLRYLLSKSVNMTASYRYVKMITELNGGVDADSIRNGFPSSQFDLLLYDNFRAPVRFTDRYQKVTVNDLKLSLLANSFDNAFTDISVYYQSGLTEFRQNEYKELNDVEYIFDDNKYSTVGGNLRQVYSNDLLKLDLLANFEKTQFDTPLLSKDLDINSFSLSAQLSLISRNKALHPAIFAKYFNYSDKKYIGFGGDVSYQIDDNYSLYAGISQFEKPIIPLYQALLSPDMQTGKQTNTIAEAKIILNYPRIDINVGYFFTQTKNAIQFNDHFFLPFYFDTGRMEGAVLVDSKLQGINFSSELKLWKIQFNTNSNFYFYKKEFSFWNNDSYILPEFSSTGGIYYVDTLFNSNLHLKAGFNYSAIGKRGFCATDFERLISSNQVGAAYTDFISNVLTFSPSFQIDFFLAGRIQNSATVYFVFENLLDSQYFIIPYHPKQARGMRFGVAWEFLD